MEKTIEIDGKKVVGRGYIANAGEIAREFFSPNVPFDKGFSFKDTFLKMTPHQDSVITSTESELVKSFVDFEPEQFTISEMKIKLDKTYDQVKKLVNLIEKGGYSTFTKKDGKMLFGKDDLYTLGVIFNSIDDTSTTYKEAVEAYYQSQKESAVEVS